MSNCPPRRDRRLPLALALSALGALWLAYGTHLFTEQGYDFLARWQEIQTLLRGFDPNLTHRLLVPDVVVPTPPELAGLEIAGRGFAIGVYPPWSYVFAVPAHWVADRELAALWYVSVFALAMLACVAISWRIAADAASTAVSREDARLVTFFAVAAAFASAAFMTDLRVGNWATFTLLALLGCLFAAQRERYLLAGVLLGLAAIKPTISLPFLLFFLIERRRVPAAVAAGATVSAGALCHWLLTGVDPLTSFVGARALDASFASQGGGLPALVEVRSGGYVTLLMNASYFVVLGGGVLALLLARKSEPLLQFALLSIVSATWTYQRSYDYVVLTFVFLWLAPLVARGGFDAPMQRLRLAAFLLLGLTNWVPKQWLGGDESAVYKTFAWWAIAVVLVFCARERSREHRRPLASRPG